MVELVEAVKKAELPEANDAEVEYWNSTKVMLRLPVVFTVALKTAVSWL
jgi:hypothetical protein